MVFLHQPKKVRTKPGITARRKDGQFRVGISIFGVQGTDPFRECDYHVWVQWIGDFQEYFVLLCTTSAADVFDCPGLDVWDGWKHSSAESVGEGGEVDGGYLWCVFFCGLFYCERHFVLIFCEYVECVVVEDGRRTAWRGVRGRLVKVSHQ